MKNNQNIGDKTLYYIYSELTEPVYNFQDPIHRQNAKVDPKTGLLIYMGKIKDECSDSSSG